METAVASEGSSPLARMPFQPRFASGMCLAARYRLTRFVAQGGMGEVYEAWDQELGIQVAIKALRQDISGDPHVLERFKQEINLARRVTHPNVCRIYDLGRHAEAGQECLFLSMELLAGETLAERLRREGRLEESAARPLVLQMVEALGAAHQAGVVHRDLKAANVVLVRDPLVEGGSRAVITDFGLAQAGADVSGSRAASTSLTGTPAYMAPEQVEGHEVGFPADIYALGVVMYEMLTGKLPFQGCTPIETALSRLKEAPPSPKQEVPGLPSAWEQVILRCMALRPEHRFQEVADILQALELPATKAPAGTRAGMKWMGVGLAVLLLAGGTLGYMYGWRSAARAKLSRKSLAILGFKNLSGRPEAAWLSTALSEMLRTELSAGEQMRTMPSDAIARAKRELGLLSPDVTGKEALNQIRENLHADLTLSGSYLQQGNTIRVDVRLQDTATGEIVATLGDSAEEARFIELVDRVGRQLRARLGLPGAGGSVKALPKDPEASRLYAQGLTKLLATDGVGARADLEQAVLRAPDFPLGHVALAEAYASLGYELKGKEAAQKAFEASRDLPQDQRLLVEVEYRISAKEWDRAAGILQSLWASYPDTPEYGLRFVSAILDGNHPKAAQAALTQLRDRAIFQGDPRLDLLEAQIAGGLGDFRAQVATAKRSMELARSRGLRFIQASALIEMGAGLRRLGDLNGSKADLEEAEGVYAALGDRGGKARSILSLGSLAYAEAHYLKAEERFQEALVEFKAIGNRKNEASALNGLGNALADQGRFSPALAAYQESKAIREELGDRIGAAKTKNNMAILFKHQGKLKESQLLYRDYLDISREAGDKQGVAAALTNLGLLHQALGDLAQAVKESEEALLYYRRTGERSGMSLILGNLALMKLDMGNLQEARTQAEEALTLSRGGVAPHSESLALVAKGLVLQEEGHPQEARLLLEKALAAQRKLGEAFVVDETLRCLGLLELEENQPALALRQLREAAGDYAKALRLMDLRMIRPILAMAELANGLASAAQTTLSRATPAETLPPSARLRYGYASALLKLNEERPAEALALLGPMEKEARSRGLLPQYFRIQLLMAQAEGATGKSVEAKARRERLAREAGAKGFTQLARMARDGN